MKTKNYKNLETWANAMRKDTQKKQWFDWFLIGGDWYVCEEITADKLLEKLTIN